MHTLRVRTNIGAVRPTNYRPAGRPICSRFDRQGRSGSYAADAQQQRQCNMCMINNIMTRRTKNVYIRSTAIVNTRRRRYVNEYVYYIYRSAVLFRERRRETAARGRQN